MTAKLLQALLVMGIILLIPVVPFLLWGAWLEPRIEQWLAGPSWSEAPFYTVAWIVGLLVADILLPIPSSNVCTFAGGVLGSWQGALVCWLGLNLSCAIGYGLAHRWGWPVVHRFADRGAVEEMTLAIQKWGAGGLAIFRAVPVLAEASVLLAGCYRLPASRFWPPVLAANLGLAVAYSVLGDLAGRYGWFGLAMAVALAGPAALLAGWWFWRKPAPDS